MARSTLLLDAHLKALKLPTFLREYDKVARHCAQEGLDCSRYLFRLCELELLDRELRATERRIKAAKFPVVKSLETFAFRAIPSVNKRLVLELARSGAADVRTTIQNGPTAGRFAPPCSMDFRPGPRLNRNRSPLPRWSARRSRSNGYPCRP